MFFQWHQGAVQQRRVWCCQRDNAEEEIRLKILQTLPLLLKPASYIITPQFVSLALDVCFHFLGDKSAVVQHTAEATVRQVRVWPQRTTRVAVVLPAIVNHMVPISPPRGLATPACTASCTLRHSMFWFGPLSQLVSLLFERLQGMLASGEGADVTVESAVLLLEVCFVRLRCTSPYPLTLTGLTVALVFF